MPRRMLSRVLLLACLSALAVLPAPADEVVLRDGERLKGVVVSLDDETLILRLVGGERRFLGRERVDRIILTPPEEVPPIRVEVKNFGSDDALDLWVNDVKVIEGSRVDREWTDVTDHLRDGSNEIRAVVLNDRQTWAYRWGLRLQGTATTFECGIPSRAGCTEEGRTGKELGEIEIRSVWVFVDRDEGQVELER